MNQPPSWTWNIPERYNIGVDVCDRWAADPQWKGRAALIWEEESGRTERYSFEGLRRQSNRAGNLLLGFAQLGDRVLLRLPNIPAFHFTFLGALKTGLLPVPSSPLLTGEEVAFLLEDSEAKILITTPELLKPIRSYVENLPFLKAILVVGENMRTPDIDYWGRLARCPEALDPLATRASDPAFLVYTSGTQGKPKGVLHAHRCLLAKDPSSLFWLDLRPEDVVCNASRLNWTFALGTGFLDALRQGCSTVVYEGQPDPDRWWKVLAKHQVTVFLAVPSFYRKLARAGGIPNPPGVLRRCCSAGEPLPLATRDDWRAKTGLDIREGLGMSELSYYVAQQGQETPIPGSCGRVLPGHGSVLLDEQGNVVSPGGIGVLATPREDPGLMLEYWRRPEEEAAMFQEDWFVSGDLFRSDEAGNLFYQGRSDDTMKSFGYKVSPVEVENVLLRHPAVSEVAVTGVSIEVGKVVVTAFVHLHEGWLLGEKTVADLAAFALEHLAAYKAPKEWRFVDSLPRTVNGKVRRKALGKNFQGE